MCIFYMNLSLYDNNHRIIIHVYYPFQTFPFWTPESLIYYPNTALEYINAGFWNVNLKCALTVILIIIKYIL